METQLSPWNSNEKLPRAEKYELPNVCTIKKRWQSNSFENSVLLKIAFVLELKACIWKDWMEKDTLQLTTIYFQVQLLLRRKITKTCSRA